MTTADDMPSATALLSDYRQGRRSPPEVVEEVAARIDRLDPHIGAFRETSLERAAAEAEVRADELRRGELRGPLHGVPVAIKELFDVEGMSGAYGSRVLDGRTASNDAEAVRRLRQAGAIVVGITRSHEFGWGITTQHAELGGTANPWDLDRVPGGSSGGSAAAVAAGMVPIALGSDTGGSIRIPSAFCGTVGIKPTYGRVSAAGAVPLAPSFDTPGPIARYVEDLEVALAALAGRDLADPSTLLPELGPTRDGGGFDEAKFLTCPDLHVRPLAPDHAKLFDGLLDDLDSDAPVREVGFAGVDRLRDTFATIQMAEAYHVHSEQLATFPDRSDLYGSDVRGRLSTAADVTLSTYLSAQRHARDLRARFDDLLKDNQLLILPVSAGGPAYRSTPDVVTHLGEELQFRDLVMDYTVPENLGHLPACVVPAGIDGDGMPVGVQVVGSRGRDRLVLHAAAALHRRWMRRLPARPPLEASA